MSTETVKLPYDQIPHIVINHPKMTGDHLFIFIHLYKVLKDYPFCCYSNTKITQKTRISLRSIDRKLNDLESWKMIERVGIGFNRKIYRGELLNITAKMTEQKLNNGAKLTDTSAKTGITHRQIGGDTKKDLRTSSNDFSLPYQEYVGRIKADNLMNRLLKRDSSDIEILEYEEWLKQQR